MKHDFRDAGYRCGSLDLVTDPIRIPAKPTQRPGKTDGRRSVDKVETCGWESVRAVTYPLWPGLSFGQHGITEWAVSQVSKQVGSGRFELTVYRDWSQFAADPP